MQRDVNARPSLGHQPVSWPARVLRYSGTGAFVAMFYSLILVAIMNAAPAMGPIWASTVSFFLCMPLGYVAHKLFSFPDRTFDAFQPIRFAVTTTLTFFTAVGGMS